MNKEEACRIAARELMGETDHFRESTKMVPLTLEQLRDMDGQPVWVQNIEEPGKSQWRLCHWDRGKYLVLQGISVQGYLLDDYGQAWIAYAYPPAHIDRDAFGCKMCKDGKTVDGQCIMLGNKQAITIRYCPNCGRPMTDEAWEALEKRLNEVIV